MEVEDHKESLQAELIAERKERPQVGNTQDSEEANRKDVHDRSEHNPKGIVQEQVER